MNKKTVFLFCILSLIVSAMAVSCASTDNRAKTDSQFVIYLGTNDKYTNQPIYTPDIAKAKTKEILHKYFGGYTIQEAEGGWVDGDTVYQEYTLVIYLSDTDINRVHSASDELIKIFNQSSVMIQTNPTITEFYSGNV